MQLVERSVAQNKALHRLAKQHGQGDSRLLGLLLNQWQLPLLAGHQALLLGQFHGCGRACVIAGLHDMHDVLCVGQIEPGNAQLFVEGQGLHITVGHAAEQGQLDGGLIKFAGLERLYGAVPCCGFAAPKVHFITGAQVGVKIVHGLVVIAGIQLAIALAT